MPANQIKHDVKEGKGSKQSLERKWKEAKDIVKDEYGTDDNHWGVVQKIYQNKRDASVKEPASVEEELTTPGLGKSSSDGPSVMARVTARLRASK